MDPLDLGPLILTPPQLPLFTLNPPHSAGRSARRGNTFQDWVIAYKLAGFWAGSQAVGGVAQSHAAPPEAVSRKVVRRFLLTVKREDGVWLPVGARRTGSAD
jgi:hypothetical protein